MFFFSLRQIKLIELKWCYWVCLFVFGYQTNHQTVKPLDRVWLHCKFDAFCSSVAFNWSRQAQLQFSNGVDCKNPEKCYVIDRVCFDITLNYAIILKLTCTKPFLLISRSLGQRGVTLNSIHWFFWITEAILHVNQCVVSLFLIIYFFGRHKSL